MDAGSGRRVVGVGYEVKSQWLDWETGGGTRQQRVEKTRERVFAEPNMCLGASRQVW